MSFPDNILTEDEKVVRSLHPHWLVVLVPSLIGLLVVAAVWVIVVLTPVDPTWDVVDWVIIALGICLLLAFVIVPFLRWRTTHYLVTNKRVIVRRGILAKAGQDIALSKITDVSFRQSFLDRVIRSGTLHIETAGDGHDEDFSNIPRSNEVQQLINRLIEEDAAMRGGYGAAARTGYEQMGGRRQTMVVPDVEPSGGEHSHATRESPTHGDGSHEGAEPTATGDFQAGDARYDRTRDDDVRAASASGRARPEVGYQDRRGDVPGAGHDPSGDWRADDRRPPMNDDWETPPQR